MTICSWLIYLLFHLAANVGSMLVMFHGDLPYTSTEIVKRIENLDDTDIIGSGGFGTVYRLVMDDGCMFAVKAIGKQGTGSERLFARELGILGSFKHRNLVNLRGYCNAPAANLLIYDYVPNGSLEQHLHGEWEETLNPSCLFAGLLKKLWEINCRQLEEFEEFKILFGVEFFYFNI